MSDQTYLRTLCPKLFALLAPVIAIALPASAEAATDNVAVAANFSKIAEKLGADFTKATGDEVKISSGATGALYTQITQGAPFGVFLSADDKRTKTPIKDGFGVDGTEFTYAVGKVVLYSPKIDVIDGETVLKARAFQHISIADPKAAPYGAAAMSVLDKLGLTQTIQPKIVTGENITQALQFVNSGSAELGFVALSQVISKPATQVWTVPQEDYPAIRQNAVLLKAAEDPKAAQAFLDDLKSEPATAVIQAAGYSLE